MQNLCKLIDIQVRKKSAITFAQGCTSYTLSTLHILIFTVISGSTISPSIVAKLFLGSVCSMWMRTHQVNPIQGRHVTGLLVLKALCDAFITIQSHDTAGARGFDGGNDEVDGDDPIKGLVPDT